MTNAKWGKINSSLQRNRGQRVSRCGSGDLTDWRSEKSVRHLIPAKRQTAKHCCQHHSSTHWREGECETLKAPEWRKSCLGRGAQTKPTTVFPMKNDFIAWDAPQHWTNESLISNYHYCARQLQMLQLEAIRERARTWMKAMLMAPFSDSHWVQVGGGVAVPGVRGTKVLIGTSSTHTHTNTVSLVIALAIALHRTIGQDPSIWRTKSANMSKAPELKVSLSATKYETAG